MRKGRLNKKSEKTNAAEPLLPHSMDDLAESVPLEDAPMHAQMQNGASMPLPALVAATRRDVLRLDNVPWKSWVPRAFIGAALIVGACFVLGFRPLYWNIALVMAVLGVFFVSKTKAETYIFDRESGRFVWLRRTLLGVKRREFWLSEIQSVTVVELSDGQGGGDPNLYIKMTDGTRVKIFSGQLFTFKDRSRVIAQRQIIDYLALDESAAMGTPVSDAGRQSPPPNSSRDGQMQRRITGILGRGSRRVKLSQSSDNLPAAAIDAQLNDGV